MSKPVSAADCITAAAKKNKIPLRLAKAAQTEQGGSVTSVHTQLLRDTDKSLP